jgi:hypothetical protein
MKPRNEVSTAAHDKSFHKMVERVVLYYGKHGHVYIPCKYEDKELATWSSNRRSEKARGELKANRIEASQKAGFVCEFKRATTNDSLTR